MTLSPNVDLGACFDKLKAAMQKSDALIADDTSPIPMSQRLTRAYSHLYATAYSILAEVEAPAAVSVTIHDSIPVREPNNQDY